MRFWKWRKQGLNFAREHSSRCTRWRHFVVDLPSETGDTHVGVWGKILKLERGHGSSTCNMRKDCNMSFDTTPFVKMIRGVDSSVSAKRSAEGYVKVWLCLLLTSRAVHWQCPSSTEHGKSTIFVKLPSEPPIFRVSDKQRTLCNWI